MNCIHVSPQMFLEQLIADVCILQLDLITLSTTQTFKLCVPGTIRQAIKGTVWYFGKYKTLSCSEPSFSTAQNLKAGGDRHNNTAVERQ